MVYLTNVELPTNVNISELQEGSFLAKSGNRREYKLDKQNALVQRIVQDLHITKPLRFASLMEASTGSDVSQHFHQDANRTSQTNAIVYLSDVENVSNGPIEFQDVGPVLGARGTAAVYAATEMHRGVANTSDTTRYALTMAFSDDEVQIRTIGANLPESGPSTKQLWWFLGAVALTMYFMYNQTYISYYTGSLTIALFALILSLLYLHKTTEPILETVDANGANMNNFNHTFTNGSRSFNTIRFKITNATNYNGCAEANINQVKIGNTEYDISNCAFSTVQAGPTSYQFNTNGTRIYLNNFSGNVSEDTIYEVRFTSPVTSFTFYTTD